MKKKLFRDEYLVNPNCTHYEIDPDDTPVPDQYDNYGCDCDCDVPPPPPPVVYPRPTNPYYVYHPMPHPPFGHPPFGHPPIVLPYPPPPPPPKVKSKVPREPIEPDVDDPVMGEYLQPEKHYSQWLIKQLSLYPRLNDSCVVQGLWTFCKDLLIRNPHACIDTPAKWNEDRLESSVVFTDHCSKELGRLTLFKTKAGEVGLELSVGDADTLGLKKVSGDVVTFAPDPTDPNSNQIVTCRWLRDHLLDFFRMYFDNEPTEGSDNLVNSGDLYTYITNIVEGLQEKLTFDTTPTLNSENPVTSDGIRRAIDDVIAQIPSQLTFDNTPTDGSSNPVTSDGIYDFVTNLINDSQYTPQIASKSRLGVMQVGDYLTVVNGLVSVDVDAIKSYLGLTSFTEADVTFVSASFDQLYSGASIGAATPAWSSSSTSVLGNCLGAGNSFLEPHFNIVVQDNGEYSLRKNWGTGTSQNNSAYRDAVDIGVRFYCRNNTTQVTKSYIPLRTVIIYNGIRQSGGGTEAGGIYWQNVQIRAWYKAYDYTLTAEDKNVINTNADAFAASLQLGYDTGTVS